MQQYPLITVVGGSGFLGRHLIKHLTKCGFRVRILVRDAVAAEFLKTAGTVGQVVPQYGDITRPTTLEGKFDGSWAVINLVSILQQSGRQTFNAINVEGARAVAEGARRAGAERFFHVSALGVAQDGDSAYARTKLAGEDAVRSAFPGATIFRPSLLIGAEDKFFQRFARMSLISPVLPLVGGGKTKFQPVLVEDVAAAISMALQTPDSIGKIYELGGPEVMSMRSMLERMAVITHRPRRLLSIPRGLAALMGRVASLLPNAPMTADQVKMLGHDNVVQPGALGFAALGMTACPLAPALPQLLARFVKE